MAQTRRMGMQNRWAQPTKSAEVFALPLKATRPQRLPKRLYIGLSVHADALEKG